MSANFEPWRKALLETYPDGAHKGEHRIGYEPYLFVTEVLGIPPYGAPGVDPRDALEKWQDEFLRSFMSNSRHSIRSGHGIGKGATIAWLALWFPLTHYDSKVIITANSQDQLRDNNWPELKKWHRRLPVQRLDPQRHGEPAGAWWGRVHPSDASG